MGGEEDRDGTKGGKILKRFKRGWMWNQFFLQEEYTGSDKQYIGKVCPLAFFCFIVAMHLSVWGKLHCLQLLNSGLDTKII